MSKSSKKTATGKAATETLSSAPPEESDASEEIAASVSIQVKKKDFVERVALRSGAKKPVARDLTEAVLASLGEALAQGETLILPPLGKISVARAVDKAHGAVLHLKLRRMTAGEGAKKDEDSGSDPLAESED